jgi:hypothetical protein
MTTLSKILLVVAVVGLTGGILIDLHGVNARPWLAAVLPLGAIASGLFLIVFMMEKEMAEYEKEQRAKLAVFQRLICVPEPRPEFIIQTAVNKSSKGPAADLAVNPI